MLVSEKEVSNLFKPVKLQELKKNCRVVACTIFYVLLSNRFFFTSIDEEGDWLSAIGWQSTKKWSIIDQEES